MKFHSAFRLSNIFTAAVFIATAAIAGEVVDVGKYEIQGQVRGPEVQFIDSDRLSADAAGRLGQHQLREMEKELLRPDSPRREAEGSQP